MILKFRFNSPYERRIILLENFMQAVLNGIIAEESGKERLNYKSCFHSVVDCVLETIFFCTV